MKVTGQHAAEHRVAQHGAVGGRLDLAVDVGLVLDRVADVPQRPGQDGDRREEGRGVGQVDRLERPRPRLGHQQARRQAADADADVEQREVRAEVALPDGRGHDRRDQATGRPARTPRARRPISAIATAACGAVWTNASRALPERLQHQRDELHAARAEPVDERADRSRAASERHERRDGEQHAHRRAGRGRGPRAGRPRRTAARARCPGRRRRPWTAAAGPRAAGRARTRPRWGGVSADVWARRPW